MTSMETGHSRSITGRSMKVNASMASVKGKAHSTIRIKIGLKATGRIIKGKGVAL